MIYKEVWSSSNETIKHIKKLQSNRNYRENCKSFILEGERAVIDAIKSEAIISTIIASTDYDASEFPELENATFFTTDSRLFAQISDTKSPQGIMAVAKMPEYDMNSLINVPRPLLIICDEVSDPGNMGTIIRTADAAGASGVLLSKGCVDLFNPKTVRSTMSSLFNVPIISGDLTANYIDYLKSAGISIVAGDPHAEKSLFDVDYTNPTAFIIGNESRGISEEVMHLSDVKVNIPMQGKAESLNAAIATAVFLYETVRQRVLK